jgi:hypothetical protein
MRDARTWILSILLSAVAACGPATRGEVVDAPPTTTDNDGDGYTADVDCNDADATINPGAAENCTDGVDNDCDMELDGMDYSCLDACGRAAYDRSSIGCVYYGVDANALGGPYAIAVSNVDGSTPANVVIEDKSSGTWTPVSGGTFTVPPRNLQTVTVPRHAITGSVISTGGAFRVTSDLPVIAYQFAPVDGSASFLSDASLLLPVSALDTYYLVPAWPQGESDDCARTQVGDPAHIQIAAAVDGTVVTVTSPVAALAGSIPPLSAGVPQNYTLNEGDFLQLTIATHQDSFDGMYIESTQPVAVFSTNDCANVPNDCAACCCEHLEEQIFGLQTWGTSYVAAQMPRRAAESSFWHILAQDDATTLTFTPGPGVTGVPASMVLNARQKMELEVSGGTGHADFVVTADKPIHVNQYTVGTFYAGTGGIGDPDMVQAVPTEQYLLSYVVLVPGTWINDYLVLVRKTGSNVTVDGAPVTTWTPVAGEWETARVPVADGVHVVDGADPVGVYVSGYDQYDSYSYPGGLNQQVINPIE